MIREPRKITVASPLKPLHAGALDIDKWTMLAENSVSFDGLLANGVTIAPNAQALKPLRWLLNDHWGPYGDGGDVKVGSDRVKLCAGYRKLSIRRGNQWGHFVDTHGMDWDFEALRQGLKEHGITRLPAPESPGKIAAGLLNLYSRPDCKGLPENVIDLAWQSSKGGRMEALTLGSFDAYELDMNSAYPYAASKLPKCDYGADCRWVESCEYLADAFYAFADLTVDIPQGLRAGPVGVRFKAEGPLADETNLRFPVGKVRCFLAKPEIDLLTDMGLKFKIHHGIWGYPYSSYQKFSELMKLLWNLRKYDKTSAKSLSVACVGQLGSAPEGIARGAWHPVYFAHVYSDIRAKLYRLALNIGLDNIHAFTIDGLLSNKPIKSAGPNVFGAWKQSRKGPCLVLNDYFKDRTDHFEYKTALLSTPDKIPQNLIRVVQQDYVGLEAALSLGLLDKLGECIERPKNLPLGSAYRQMPDEITRQDYLRGSIKTWL